MDAARVIREARRRAGLTQRDLAAKVGVPQPQIARIESGASVPRVDTLDRFLEACGEGLETLPRPGIGVDRTMYPGALELSARARLIRAARDAAGFERVEVAAGRQEVPRSFDFLAALERISAEEVRFVLIGSLASRVHSSNIVAQELELVCSWTRENLERLAKGLRALQGQRRGSTSGRVQAAKLERSDQAALNTNCGPVVVTRFPPGFLGGYDELERGAVEVELGSTRILVATLDDLIRMNRSTGRPRDLVMVENLGALRDHLDSLAQDERQKRRKR